MYACDVCRELKQRECRQVVLVLVLVLVVCPCFAIFHRPLAWYTVSDEQLYVDIIMLGPWNICLLAASLRMRCRALSRTIDEQYVGSDVRSICSDGPPCRALLLRRVFVIYSRDPVYYAREVAM